MAKTKSFDNSVDIAVIGTNVEFIKTEVQDLKEAIANLSTTVSQKYVTQDEFKPVKAIAFGIIVIITTGVLGALLTLILRK